MRPHSDDLAAAVQNSHTAVCRVDIVQDGKVIGQLDDVFGGQAVSDGTAAQRTQWEVYVADPDGTLAPDGMESALAPYGTRLQLWRGARLQDVDLRRRQHNTAASWQTYTEFGLNSGTVGSASDGALVMGP